MSFAAEREVRARALAGLVWSIGLSALTIASAGVLLLVVPASIAWAGLAVGIARRDAGWARRWANLDLWLGLVFFFLAALSVLAEGLGGDLSGVVLAIDWASYSACVLVARLVVSAMATDRSPLDKPSDPRRSPRDFGGSS